MAELFSNFGNITWQMVVMWLIGALLIYLAIKKDMEPALLLPMGFGAILVNIPVSGAVETLETWRAFLRRIHNIIEYLPDGTTVWHRRGGKIL